MQNFDSDSSYGRKDAFLLQAALDHIKTSTQVYGGNWTARWLLVPIDAPVWHLSTPSGRKIEGKWLRTEVISWSVKLANGTNLMDEANDAMRLTIQKIGFLMRALPMFNVTTSSAHINRLRMLLNIVQWLYKNTETYQPRENQFKGVDSDSICDYMYRSMLGGTAWALELPERTLGYFYLHALNAKVPSLLLANPFTVPPSDAHKISDWLLHNGYFFAAETRNQKAHISRDKLAIHLSCERDVLQTPKFSCFLRQFEPELKQSHPTLLTPSSGWSTEFLTHTTPTIHEVINLKGTYGRGNSILETWRQIFRLQPHLPNAIPLISEVAFKKAGHVINIHSGRDGLTPWIPLSTAIAYTSKALELIHEVAEPLILFYIKCITHFNKIGLFNLKTDKSVTTRFKRAKRDEWVKKNVPSSLEKYGVARWTSVFSVHNGNNTFEKLRSSPSVGDLLEIFVGATISLTGTLKPIREGELRYLRRDCVTRKGNQGYWITHLIGKSGQGQTQVEVSHPIPYVVAKALLMLKKLGESVVALSKEKDQFAENSLLYIPILSRSGGFHPRLLDTASFNRILDVFCDYVNVPPDELGRRWYVRTHELRKSFLITLFWSFKFSSIDAARWIAGHTNSSHIDNYIRSIFPGMEMTKIEAQYASQQLWNFKVNPGDVDIADTAKLYTSVCEHFGVNELSIVNTKELEFWLETAFSEGLYRIEAFQIESKKTPISVSFAFRIRETESVKKR
jgi:hypothetical protein